jgi:hypothetical protein
VSLPEFTPDARCPKCAYDAIQTKWRLGFHWDGICTVPEDFERRAWLYGMPSLLAEDMARSSGGPPPVPEHLERRCVRCDYFWDEALAA